MYNNLIVNIVSKFYLTRIPSLLLQNKTLR
uniref:Uncharacterized protein n=1 Tax=Anguilla anguilla TaxID=7936 RepID=A0A0E9VXQ7_ANGAN